MLWLVFDVGCIECGEESAVVGVYSSRKQAKAIAEAWGSQPGTLWGRKEWHGRHYVDVFPLEIPNMEAQGVE